VFELIIIAPSFYLITGMRMKHKSHIQQ